MKLRHGDERPPLVTRENARRVVAVSAKCVAALECMRRVFNDRDTLRATADCRAILLDARDLLTTVIAAADQVSAEAVTP